MKYFYLQKGKHQRDDIENISYGYTLSADGREGGCVIFQKGYLCHKAGII